MSVLILAIIISDNCHDVAAACMISEFDSSWSNVSDTGRLVFHALDVSLALCCQLSRRY